MTAREFLSGHRSRLAYAPAIMIAPARLAAYDVLRAVNSGRADLPAALARARARLEDERDRALAGEIATGTLRWQGAFDLIVAAFTKRPVAKLDPEVLDILRMTTFQLLHLDRIPASAAVNDAVNLVSKAGKKSAAGLVNAVLRRISRERAQLPLPPKALGSRPERAGRARLSVRHAVASRVAGAAVARSLRLRRDRSLGALQQQPGGADPPRQYACATSRPHSQQQLLQHDVATRPDPLCARRARRHERQSSADAACRRRSLHRPGRIIAARRAC